jgi:hypothetical protein
MRMRVVSVAQAGGNCRIPGKASARRLDRICLVSSEGRRQSHQLLVKTFRSELPSSCGRTSIFDFDGSKREATPATQIPDSR